MIIMQREGAKGREREREREEVSYHFACFRQKSFLSLEITNCLYLFNYDHDATLRLCCRPAPTFNDDHCRQKKKKKAKEKIK